MQTVSVPFADTAAGDLTFSLVQGRLPAVHSVTAVVPGASGPLHVELAVLGCSHQVIVTASGTELVETLACLPDSAPALPADRLTAGVGGAAVHDFRSRVDQVPPAEFLPAVEEIVDRAQSADHHAVVAFPGHPGAVTALALDPAGDDSLAWRTWHCYPQHGEIVRTRTVLTGLSGAHRPPADSHPCPARGNEVTI